MSQGPRALVWGRPLAGEACLLFAFRGWKEPTDRRRSRALALDASAHVARAQPAQNNPRRSTCKAGSNAAIHYICANAAREFAALPGCGPNLPVETTANSTSASCQHWQEATLDRELMTPVSLGLWQDKGSPGLFCLCRSVSRAGRVYWPCGVAGFLVRRSAGLRNVGPENPQPRPPKAPPKRLAAPPTKTPVH